MSQDVLKDDDIQEIRTKQHFLVKVKHYVVEDENGEDKARTDEFIFKAVNWIDAETQAVMKFTEELKEGFRIKAINPKSYDNVINGEKEMYFHASVNYFDEGGKVAKWSSPLQWLINADDSDDADKIINKEFEKSVQAWKRKKITETNIIEVIIYDED